MAEAPITELHISLDDSRELQIVGRDAWALNELLRAGERGCTAIEHSRWSHYIFKLRKVGVVVETITESHAGAYAGHHARYVLRSSVQVLTKVRAGEDRHAA